MVDFIAEFRNNYIWANESSNHQDFAIRLSHAAVNIYGNHIIPGAISGIFLASTTCNIRIENNHFAGSENLQTGWGVYANGAKLILLTGNIFQNLYRGGIFALSTELLNISKNVFSELNCSGDDSGLSNYDIVLEGSVSFLSTGHVIEGNAHFREHQMSQNYAICVGTYAQAIVVNNSVIDKCENKAYKTPSIAVYPSKYSISKDNRVTVRQNTVTHPCQFDEGEKPVSHCSFSNRVYIPFSVDFSLQGFTPKMQDLNIVFMGAAENSAVAFNVWGLDCLGFYIRSPLKIHYFSNKSVLRPTFCFFRV